jgi:transcriptional antiterminator Rof (Rho-off)
MDRCDLLDMLEEAALADQPLEIHLRDGETMQTRVREVLTRDGEDYAILEDGACLSVSTIAECRRRVPRPTTYEPKLD